MKIFIRTIIYLLIFVGFPAFGMWLDNETVTPVFAIIYILVLIPIGILKLIDFYNTNDGTGLSRVFNALFRVPLGLFGLLCIVVGVAIIGWVLYNIFIERQKEYSGPGFILGIGSFGVGVPLVLFGWLMLRSALRRKEVSAGFSRYVTFQSEFNGIEELPGQMLGALRGSGIEIGSRIIEEDEGWAISFRHADDSYNFCSRFDITSEPFECMGWLELKRGFVSSLFGPRETNNYPALEPIIQAALASLPTVRNVTWGSNGDAA